MRSFLFLPNSIGCLFACIRRCASTRLTCTVPCAELDHAPQVQPSRLRPSPSSTSASPRSEQQPAKLPTCRNDESTPERRPKLTRRSGPAGRRSKAVAHTALRASSSALRPRQGAVGVVERFTKTSERRGRFVLRARRRSDRRRAVPGIGLAAGRFGGSLPDREREGLVRHHVETNTSRDVARVLPEWRCSASRGSGLPACHLEEKDCQPRTLPILDKHFLLDGVCAGGRSRRAHPTA
mmetsp:Transcript_4657/g.29427  ORF Transcript_4657/g.29427 Transcript_4657/m.29427 type:complete len:238 (+) Transcript_4657:983-1696(+)